MQTKVKIKGFSLEDLAHPLSKWENFCTTKTMNHFVNIIIPKRDKQKLPEAPPVELQSLRSFKLG